jgi:hypothetical protein
MNFAKTRRSLHRPLWRTSSINQPDAKNLGPSGPDSRPEKKKRERAVEADTPMEIDNRCPSAASS